MFNILNTILVAAIVTVEVYGLFLGVYLMLFEGVTTREGVVKALEGRNQLVIVCGQISPPKRKRYGGTSTKAIS